MASSATAPADRAVAVPPRSQGGGDKKAFGLPTSRSPCKLTAPHTFQNNSSETVSPRTGPFHISNSNKPLPSKPKSYESGKSEELVDVATEAEQAKADTIRAELEEVGDILREMRHLDPTLFKSLHWMLHNDIENVIYETFSVMVSHKDESTGQMKHNEIALCPKGEEKRVTELNKLEYIRLLVQWKTHYSVSVYLDPFLQAFHEVVPVHQLQEADIQVRAIYAMRAAYTVYAVLRIDLASFFDLCILIFLAHVSLLTNIHMPLCAAAGTRAHAERTSYRRGTHVYAEIMVPFATMLHCNLLLLSRAHRTSPYQ